VIRAREVQQHRFAEYNTSAQKPVHCNAQMTPKLVREYCVLDDAGDKLLAYAMDKMGLSARAYDRILKVARTIADLDNSNSNGILIPGTSFSANLLHRRDGKDEKGAV
jgi:magnesium chelatase family protein